MRAQTLKTSRTRLTRRRQKNKLFVFEEDEEVLQAQDEEGAEELVAEEKNEGAAEGALPGLTRIRPERWTALGGVPG